MPIYEYQCQACGHHLEEIQGFNDKPLVKCPACGKSKLTKLVSAPSFQLKGAGWYVTDFKDSKKATKSGADNTGNKEGGEKTNKESSKDKVKEVKEKS